MAKTDRDAYEEKQRQLMDNLRREPKKKRKDKDKLAENQAKRMAELEEIIAKQKKRKKARKNKTKGVHTHAHEREAEALAAVTWIEVERPKKWRFTEATAELVGRFVAVETRTHPEYGVYQCVLVRTPEGVVYATGSVLLDLVTAAGLRADEFMRVIYTGTVETRAGHECNLYRLQIGGR